MYFTLLGIGDFLDWEAFSSVLSGMRGVERAIFKRLESLHGTFPLFWERRMCYFLVALGALCHLF